MGRSEKRELYNRLGVLLLHLLKWQYQPALRGSSWRRTIREQRRALARHLADNPSLKALLPEAVCEAYGDALIAAEDETGRAADSFPETSPYGLAEILAEDFWPGPRE